jgi:hypothetical protein
VTKAIELFENRDYRGARAALEKGLAGHGDLPEAREVLALIAFYYAEDEVAAKHLEKVKGESYYAAALRVCLDGPFRSRFGEAAFLTEGRSDGGHYYLATDVGANASAIEGVKGQFRKLNSDPAKNAKALEKLRAGRTEGFKQVAALLELMYAEYSGMFKAEKDEKLVSRVFLFEKRNDFLAFSKRMGSSGEGAAGYYSPRLRILVVDASMGAEKRGVLFDEGMDTLLHEGFHQFLHFYLEEIPYWFNEGIAEYYGPSEVVPGQRKLKVGLVPKQRGPDGFTRYQVIQLCLKPNGPMPLTPLKELVRLDARRVMEKADVHYPQAWAFIHYLANGHPKGKKMLVEYFKALRAGKDEAGALEAAFAGVDWARLEADWREYVKRM